MIIHKFGWPFRLLYPMLVWRKKTNERVIYLTFDDGPIPEVTEWVLDLLDQYNSKATFFCVGGNVEKHPDIYKMLTDRGHSVGNHTHNHLPGMHTPDAEYIENIDLCERVMKVARNKPLFRPPYGKLRRSQIRKLRDRYEIIMWEVLTADYDTRVDKEKCLAKAIQHTRKGSIVLFHDSIKTFEKIQYVLPRFLAHFIERGYRFESI